METILGYALVVVITFFMSIVLVKICLGLGAIKRGNRNSRLQEIWTGTLLLFLGIGLIYLIREFIVLPHILSVITLWGGVCFILFSVGRLYKIVEAKKIIAKAKKMELQDQGNPFEIDYLAEAFNLYEKYNEILYSRKIIEKTKRIEAEIAAREKYNKLYQKGEEKYKEMYFKSALVFFENAHKLYTSNQSQHIINECLEKSQQEEKYNINLAKAKLIAQEGQIEEAIATLQKTLSEFPRQDGKKLFVKLKTFMEGEKHYSSGLIAEEGGYLEEANKHYKQSLKLIPHLIPAKIRLVIIAIKQRKFAQALQELNNIEGEEATYLRGFIYATQQNWQQAQIEWQNIDHPEVKKQIDKIKILVQRETLLAQKNIEIFLEKKDLEQAHIYTLIFLEKYGFQPTIERNLENHIKPALKSKLWQTKDYQLIAQLAEQNWREAQDITSLHNWAVACYYNQDENIDNLQALISAWATALANLKSDPAFADLPWLQNAPINLSEIEERLTYLLEEIIEKLKESNLSTYLQLRDRYRQEFALVKLLKKEQNLGIIIKDLIITPECYSKYCQPLPNIQLPANIWGSLYTNWGKAVAACLESDINRAREIKPKQAKTPAEIFGYRFVSYHEGFYYLQQHNWRQGMKCLEQAKEEIASSSDWQQQLDKLCLAQRLKIEDLDEHLAFAQSWYSLTSSQPAKSYLAEYKAKKIIQKLIAEKISTQKALLELKAIKTIDPDNEIVLKTIADIELAELGEKIHQTMSQGHFAEAVKQAEDSGNEELRYMVAEILINILIQGIDKGNLPHTEISQLAAWAYSLCPDEPTFRPIYVFLGLE